MSIVWELLGALKSVDPKRDEQRDKLCQGPEWRLRWRRADVPLSFLQAASLQRGQRILYLESYLLHQLFGCKGQKGTGGMGSV